MDTMEKLLGEIENKVLAFSVETGLPKNQIHLVMDKFVFIQGKNIVEVAKVLNNVPTYDAQEIKGRNGKIKLVSEYKLEICNSYTDPFLNIVFNNMLGIVGVSVELARLPEEFLEEFFTKQMVGGEEGVPYWSFLGKQITWEDGDKTFMGDSKKLIDYIKQF